MDDYVQLLSGIAEPGPTAYARAAATPTVFVPNLSVPGALSRAGVKSIAQHPFMPRVYVGMEGGERLNGLARAGLRGLADVVDTTPEAPPVVMPSLLSGIDGKSAAVGAGLALLGAFLWKRRGKFGKSRRRR